MKDDVTPQEIASNLIRELSDRGQIIEGGWRAFEKLSLDPISAGKVQREECKKAFFFGAQHLWASFMGVLDPGNEPSDDDMRRAQLICDELKAFVERMKNGGRA